MWWVVHTHNDTDYRKVNHTQEMDEKDNLLFQVRVLYVKATVYNAEEVCQEG